ncbi:DUF6270 domain-containing protein [Agrococcus terreus]|uniref:SGNH/GDSL hydrolase family protein n=1 Tax=Agrococcus terreus TaxID=574649 RepID=A0ABQ2KCZ3_9MICO|nr:DUF6270 domain-containing protein [Agrococcus terreus]GGN79826.1 hypothetical protein GCM10010968_07110 [Agrococcus terreus]
MPEPDDRPARILVYGSCVARDTVEFAESAGVDLVGYIARQSLLSAGSDASEHLPRELGVPSKFQARMIRADFAGTLLERLATDGTETDAIIWDLADERHGVHRFADSSFVTRSIDTIKADAVVEAVDAAEHLAFGTDEHFALWSQRVEAFEQFLREHDLLDRLVVLEVPWAVRTTEGKPSPWSMGVRAKDANALYRRYYDLLRRRGHRMVTLRDDQVLADPSHRWGLAPFHYSPDAYREILRQLREEHGLTTLRPAE